MIAIRKYNIQKRKYDWLVLYKFKKLFENGSTKLETMESFYKPIKHMKPSTFFANHILLPMLPKDLVRALLLSI
jgi:hypothetical protein